MSTTRVNCWFCGENSSVKPEEKDSWTCQSCQQYNGFTEEGDYNKPIASQYDVKDYKTRTMCSPASFHTGKSVLCDNCSQNQVLKVRQLAAFTPFCDATYDEEVDMYKHYLDNIYSLCSTCQKHVIEYLSAQDSKLYSKMDDSQLNLLDQLKNKKYRNTPESNMEEEEGIHKPLLPLVLFVLCSVAAFVYFIFNLRLFAVSEAGTASAVKHSLISRGLKSLVFMIPAQYALQGEEVALYLGAALCVGGLVASGKYSIYPEDAIHLLLWLVSIVTASDVFSASLSWLHVPRSITVCISCVTLCVSILCCRRSRLPRHFTAVTFHKKPISQPRAPIQEVSDKNQQRHRTKSLDQSENKHMNMTSSSGQSSSAEGRADDGVQYENIRQDLESISLGLGKISGSTSSIWSLPAVVASSSSDMIPDSSTDHSAALTRQPRSLVSPSRLGFLNFDSRPPSRDSLSGSSRSPSPWSHQPSTDTSINANQVVPDVQSKIHLPTTQASSRGLIKPIATKLYSAYYQPSFSPPQYSSLLRNTQETLLSRTEDATGPCDSQTSGLGTSESSRFIHDMNKPDGYAYRDTVGRQQQSWRGETSGSRETQTHVGHSLSGSEMLMSMHRPMGSDKVENQNHGSKTLRRSQRIAMAGRSPKPWPMKKSLSCNNAYDKENLEKAGMHSRNMGRVSTDRSVHGNVAANSKGDPLSTVPEQDSGFMKNQKYQNDRDARISYRKDVFSNGVFRRNMQRKQRISEFSDDEDENGINTVNDKWSWRRRADTIGRRNDVSWQWIFIGLVIGVSITTNIFLSCYKT